MNENEKTELIEKLENIFDDCCKKATDKEKKLLLSYLQDLRTMFNNWDKT